MNEQSFETVRRHVLAMAEHGPLARRLRKLGKKGFADVVNGATARLCGNLPPFVNNPRRLRKLGGEGLAAEITEAAARIRGTELWLFFEVPPQYRDKLAHLALDAERKRFIRETERVGGVPLEPKSPVTVDAGEGKYTLARHTETGQQYSTEPIVMLAREAAEAAELAQIDARPEIEAAEVRDFTKAVLSWAATLPIRQQWAVHWIGQGVRSNSEVNRRIKEQFGRGVDRKRIAELRAEMTSIADRLVTVASNEQFAATESAAESAPGVPNLPEDATGNDPTATDFVVTDVKAIEGGFQTLQQTALSERSEQATESIFGLGDLRATEMDTADSANDPGSSGRSRTGALLGSRWGHGRRYFPNIDQQVLADHRTNPEYLAGRQQYASKFKEPELRILHQESDAAGVDLLWLMRELSKHDASKTTEQVPVTQPTQEQLLAQMDAVQAALFRLALQVGLSVQTFREMLQVADRQNLVLDWDKILKDALAFRNRPTREPVQLPSRGRDHKSGRSIPVTVKPRKRRAA
jgi:hypothetical protein